MCWPTPRDHRKSASTRAVQLMNDIIPNDDRVNNVMLTIRDGITLVRKRDAHLT